MTAEWTTKIYWNVVLGERDARDCVVDGELGSDEEIDAWLAKAESEAWKAGSLEGEQPAEWATLRAEAAEQIRRELDEQIKAARDTGADRGREAAAALYDEDGIEALRRAIHNGTGWSEPAACADAASFDDIPRVQVIRDAYYEAYEEAACEEAEELDDRARQWRLYEENFEYRTIEADTLEEALDEAKSNVDRANYPDAEGTIWIHVTARNALTDETGSRRVTCEPDDPECIEGKEHDWQSPYEILGGLEENPGVWANGGGVVIHEVCMHCGCERITDTWAQDPDSGEQGLRSVTYKPAEYRDEVAAMREDDDEEEEEADARKELGHMLDSVTVHHREVEMTAYGELLLAILQELDGSLPDDGYIFEWGAYTRERAKATVAEHKGFIDEVYDDLCAGKPLHLG